MVAVVTVDQRDVRGDRAAGRGCVLAGRPLITGVLADLMSAWPTPVRRELYVAGPVWAFLRERYATAAGPGATDTMAGVLVVVDGGLAGGQWQIREDGQVVKSGDMAPAPDGMVVVYDRHGGWLAVDEDLALSTGLLPGAAAGDDG